MNRKSKPRTPTTTPSISVEKPAHQDSPVVAVPPSVVRIFEKISDPRNAHLFTAQAAHEAFRHLETKK
jgi:hypothetical protein